MQERCGDRASHMCPVSSGQVQSSPYDSFMRNTSPVYPGASFIHPPTPLTSWSFLPQQGLEISDQFVGVEARPPILDSEVAALVDERGQEGVIHVPSGCLFVVDPVPAGYLPDLSRRP